ncbi:MAG: hypothetical protein KGM24_05095 [Elusimicrobia bacterium]|nr:hypothetical protein [Elusimicrobiota bacterium]
MAALVPPARKHVARYYGARASESCPRSLRPSRTQRPSAGSRANRRQRQAVDADAAGRGRGHETGRLPVADEVDVRGGVARDQAHRNLPAGVGHGGAGARREARDDGRGRGEHDGGAGEDEELVFHAATVAQWLLRCQFFAPSEGRSAHPRAAFC